MSSIQTPQGMKTTITMVKADGSPAPSVIHLADASSVTPAADGSVQVWTDHVDALMRAGWAIKVTSGTIHVQ